MTEKSDWDLAYKEQLFALEYAYEGKQPNY
jgi:hypothetical protein